MDMIFKVITFDKCPSSTMLHLRVIYTINNLSYRQKLETLTCVYLKHFTHSGLFFYLRGKFGNIMLDIDECIRNTPNMKTYFKKSLSPVLQFFFQFSNWYNCNAKILVASVTNFEPPRMTKHIEIWCSKCTCTNKCTVLLVAVHDCLPTTSDKFVSILTSYWV